MSEVIDLWRTRWQHRAVDLEREESEPWALPLIVRAERIAPPDHQHALTAAADAVVRLLTVESSAPDGPWYPAVSRWADGYIRKVVRRARGVRWPAVGELPGVTVAAGTAEVRALLPHPVSSPPAQVARLQVEGLDLNHDQELALPAPAEGPVLTIALDPTLRLSTGKACAQVGHAAQLGLLELDRDLVHGWAAAGFPVHVVPDDRVLWQQIVAKDGAEVAPVHDAGFTEIAAGTLTCASTFLPMAGKLG